MRRVEFDVLVERGVFGEDDRLQLLDGELVIARPQGVAHARIVEALNERLMPALIGRARVRVQLPLAAGEHSEPEPDIAVVPADAPRDRHPETALLVIEVADTSLTLDLGRKAGIYAAVGVPVYWVIDTSTGVVHVHTDPSGSVYGSVRQCGRADELDAVGVRIRLGELFD